MYPVHQFRLQNTIALSCVSSPGDLSSNGGWSGTCNAGCLENDPVLGHNGSPSDEREWSWQFHTEVGARLQGSIPCWVSPCALNNTRLGTKRPQHLEQKVWIHRSHMKQMFPRFSQKQYRSPEAWLVRSPPESTKSKLYLPNANAARKVNPTAHHASARRNLPPCMVHPIRVVMGATLRLVSRLLEAQGTSQIDKRPRY